MKCEHHNTAVLENGAVKCLKCGEIIRYAPRNQEGRIPEEGEYDPSGMDSPEGPWGRVS